METLRVFDKQLICNMQPLKDMLSFKGWWGFVSLQQRVLLKSVH
jgi:hypothetical protein